MLDRVLEEGGEGMYAIGEIVNFKLAPDIEAAITEISINAHGKQYHVAWINAGNYQSAWVQEFEIEKK